MLIINSLESLRNTLDIREYNHPFTGGVLVSFLGSFCFGKIFLGTLVLYFRNGPIGVVAFCQRFLDVILLFLSIVGVCDYPVSSVKKCSDDAKFSHH